jgi:hypothetical protein
VALTIPRDYNKLSRERLTCMMLQALTGHFGEEFYYAIPVRRRSS